MRNCEQITRLCSEELEHPLGFLDRAELRMHIMMCSGCRNFRTRMGLLRKIAQAYGAGGAPASPDESDR